MQPLLCTCRGMAGRSRSLSSEAGARWRVVRRLPRWRDCAGQPRCKREKDETCGPHGSVLPDHPDHYALDQDIPLLKPHGLHGGVGGLEPNPATRLAVELFDRCLAAVHQSDDHFTIFGRLLAMHDDDVTVDYVLVDHRGTLNPEPVIRTSAGEHVLRHRDALFMHERFDRGTGSDLAQERDLA